MSNGETCLPYCLVPRGRDGERMEGKSHVVGDGWTEVRRRSCFYVVRWEKSFLLFFLILAPGRHGAILFCPAKCVCATVTHRQLELLLSVVRKRECVSVLTQGPSDASLPSCRATSTLISCLPRPFRDS